METPNCGGWGGEENVPGSDYYPIVSDGFFYRTEESSTFMRTYMGILAWYSTFVSLSQLQYFYNFSVITFLSILLALRSA